MTTAKMINPQGFRDGKIVLYQLENRPEQLWLCRIKVPKGTGYVYRGTGTSDLYEARKFAEDLYEEFLVKIRLGQSITGHNLGKSGPIFRDRIMLTNYVLILANTGIRVGETRGLRWMDVDSERVTEGEPSDIILHVSSKTGTREVVARSPDIKTCFERIWDLRCKEVDGRPPKEEYIFSHKDGTPIQSFKKGFAALVHEAGVEFDRSGDRRTIYSLRHTYATFRLQEGVNHYVLARNMGTSVKMLEQHYGHTSNRAMADELTKHKEKMREKLAWE
jgi:integrase